MAARGKRIGPIGPAVARCPRGGPKCRAPSEPIERCWKVKVNVGRDEQKPEFHSSDIGDEHCQSKGISAYAHHNLSRLKINRSRTTNQLIDAVNSSSRAVVMLQDTAVDALAFDLAERRIGNRRWLTRERERAIVFALMRTMAVVEICVALGDKVEVLTTETEEQIQALSLDRYATHDSA